MSTLIFPSRNPGAFSALKTRTRQRSTPGIDIGSTLRGDRDESSFDSTSNGNGNAVGSSSAGASSGVKTIQMNLAPRRQPDFDSSSALKTLVDSFPSILSQSSTVSVSSSTPSFEHLYNLCHKLVSPPYDLGPAIYEAFKLAIRQRGRDIVRELKGSVMAQSTPSSGPKELDVKKKGVKTPFLSELLKRWREWELGTMRLESVLLFLDKGYLTHQSQGIELERASQGDHDRMGGEGGVGEQNGVGAEGRGPVHPLSLRQIGLDTFRTVVLEDPLIKERCERDVVDWVRGARCGSSTATTTTREEPIQPSSSVDASDTDTDADADEQIVKSFLTLTMLLSASAPFVESYISETRSFYEQESRKRVEPALRAARAAEEGITANKGAEDKMVVDSAAAVTTSTASALVTGGARTTPTSNAETGRAASAFVNWLDSIYASERARCLSIWIGGAVSGGTKIPSSGPEIWRLVKKVLDTEVSEKHLLSIAQQALNESMDASDAIVMKKLYLSLINIRMFAEFKKAFSKHVTAHCKALIGDPGKDSQMVPSLLQFKRFCETAIDALYEDPKGDRTSDGKTISPVEARRRLQLETEMREGIKAGVETRQAVPAEMIAKYLDVVMRRGQGTMTSDQFNTLLDEIVSLVKFTKDKDIFKEFYVAQLAKRLLLGRSASFEEELSMVKKLQSEYGEEFTTGDAMMKDLSQSEEMNKKFTELRLKKGEGPSKLSVSVLSQGQWPPYKQLGKGWEHLALPQDMQKSLDEFSAWYNHTYSGRVLSWRHQHTSVTLTARFPGGNKEVGVSLFQALVLLQFNDTTTMDFEEIYARTGIERSELIRTLQSLYAKKETRMLVKRPPGKDVAPTDKFVWNQGFTRDRIKFKINQLQQDLSAEESKQATEKVFEDRTLTLDAQIVRIMKGKKALKLNELVNETVDAVKNMFQPEVKAIKTQVESLIEREYLERDEEDRNLLKYLA